MNDHVPGAIEKLKIGDALFPLDAIPADLRRRYDRANLMVGSANGADAVRKAKQDRRDVVAEIAAALAPQIAIRGASRGYGAPGLIALSRR